MADHAPDSGSRPRTWDIFCTLIDNFGDVGVCWRLAVNLADRGQRVRIWADDPSPLAFMAPDGHAGVDVLLWPADDAGHAWPAAADVVVELLGCELPAAYVERMAAAERPPVWINLEHLSAEPFVERSHGLPSPQRNGLPKWFFFPGFTPGTGGLLRETGLLAARERFDGRAWLAARGIRPLPAERVALLFCYASPALPAMLAALARQPTVILATQGHAQEQLRAIGAGSIDGLRVVELPWLNQTEFDRTLWSADLNFVRGEDSLVRAIWAAKPFIWQVYPLEAALRERKQDALLAAMAGAIGRPAWCKTLATAFRRHNGLGADGGGNATPSPIELPEARAWGEGMQRWCEQLATRADLATQLIAFADDKAAPGSTRAGAPPARELE